MANNLLFQQHFLSTKSLSLEEVELILETANKIKHHPDLETLQKKIIATCFFEPSTRTRLSFESAALRLGAKVIGFSGDEGLSIQKGETLADTMRVISGYADLIVIRHPSEGSARLAAEVASCPVINGGDGANQHPTQALLDLYTVQECQPRLNGLSIALAGDLKYGRSIHSFIDVCSLYDIRLYFISPEILSLPDSICDILKKRGTRFSFHHSLEEVIPKVDILYMSRIQQERFSKADYQLIKNQFILTAKLLEKAKSNLKVLHALPRVNEISCDVDKTPYAYYFQQASHGVLVRQAILSLILNESLS